MSGSQLFALYLTLNAAGLLAFCLWASRRQLAFDRLARVAPAEFIGWRESVRQGRVNRDYAYTAIYRFRRDGVWQEVGGLSVRSRVVLDRADPLGWPLRVVIAPHRRRVIVRYLPDAEQKPQLGSVASTWGSLLLLWLAGLALLLWALSLFHQR